MNIWIRRIVITLGSVNIGYYVGSYFSKANPGLQVVMNGVVVITLFACFFTEN